MISDNEQPNQKPSYTMRNRQMLAECYAFIQRFPFLPFTIQMKWLEWFLHPSQANWVFKSLFWFQWIWILVHARAIFGSSYFSFLKFVEFNYVAFAAGHAILTPWFSKRFTGLKIIFILVFCFGSLFSMYAYFYDTSRPRQFRVRKWAFEFNFRLYLCVYVISMHFENQKKDRDMWTKFGHYNLSCVLKAEIRRTCRKLTTKYHLWTWCGTIRANHFMAFFHRIWLWR